MVQADVYNASRLATVIVAVVTSNTALAAMPGNVLTAGETWESACGCAPGFGSHVRLSPGTAR